MANLVCSPWAMSLTISRENSDLDAPLCRLCMFYVSLGWEVNPKIISTLGQRFSFMVYVYMCQPQYNSKPDSVPLITGLYKQWKQFPETNPCCISYSLQLSSSPKRTIKFSWNWLFLKLLDRNGTNSQGYLIRFFSSEKEVNLPLASLSLRNNHEPSAVHGLLTWSAQNSLKNVASTSQAVGWICTSQRHSTGAIV